jgi:deazaflavin-dependent oxidoreductase (nitroreductase family)
VFNPTAMQNGKWTIIQHVGRSSGKPYRTPIGTWRVGDTYYVIVVYGPKTDWLRNVLAAGSAVLEVDGEQVPVTNLRLVSIDDAFAGAPTNLSRPPRFLRITQCLAMDVAA